MLSLGRTSDNGTCYTHSMAKKTGPDINRPGDINPAHILSIARGFRDVFRMLWKPGPPVPGDPLYPVQAAVIGAFALELFLKYLLVLEERGAQAKGHKPSLLFDRLDSATRDRLVVRARELGVAPTRWQPDLQLRTALAELDGAFETWRYVYEKSGAHISPNKLDSLLELMDSVAGG